LEPTSGPLILTIPLQCCDPKLTKQENGEQSSLLPSSRFCASCLGIGATRARDPSPSAASLAAALQHMLSCQIAATRRIGGGGTRKIPHRPTEGYDSRAARAAPASGERTRRLADRRGKPSFRRTGLKRQHPHAGAPTRRHPGTPLQVLPFEASELPQPKPAAFAKFGREVDDGAANRRLAGGESAEDKCSAQKRAGLSCSPQK
jgi:hypothetical protein